LKNFFLALSGGISKYPSFAVAGKWFGFEKPFFGFFVAKISSF
jgi:hypothetical protein